MEVPLNATVAQLSLALFIQKGVQPGLFMKRALGTSVLFWEKEQKVVQLPDFYFSFCLGLNAREPEIESLLNSLRFHYKRALKLGKKADYEMSTDAAILGQLRRVTVPHLTDAERIEAMLGRAQATQVDTLYAEDSRSWREKFMPQEEEDEDDPEVSEAEFETGHSEWPRNHFVEIETLPGGPYSDAFQSVHKVHCRTHEVAMTLVHYLIPLMERPTANVTAANPPPQVGKTFFLGDGLKATGHLVSLVNGIPKAYFKFAKAPANAALAHVVQQLGTFEALVQRWVKSTTARLPPADGLLLTPAATPFFHPVLGVAGGLPQPNLLVCTRVQPYRGGTDTPADRLYNATYVPLDAGQYMGVLGRDCVVERRFSVTRIRAAGATPAKGPPVERKRVQSTLDDALESVPRIKRTKLMRDTLDFNLFLVKLRSGSDFRTAFPEGREADFVDVLVNCPDYGGLPKETVHASVRWVVAGGWMSKDARIAQLYLS